MRKCADILLAAILAAVLPGTALPASAGDAVWKGTASGVWDDGALNWTVDGAPNQPFTDGDSVVFDDSASTFSGILCSNTVAPSSVLVSNTTRYTFTYVLIGGTGQLVKAGTGELSIPRDGSGTNTYTGGTVVNEGILSFTYDRHLGDPAAPLTMNGAQLNLGDRSWTSTRPVFVNGDSRFRAAGNCNWTCAGPVSGTGAVSVGAVPNGGSSIKFSSLTNTFTGELVFDTSLGRFTFGIASLVDTPGSGNINIMPCPSGTWRPTLRWRSDATNALVLNNRSIEFSGDGDMGPLDFQNDNSSYPITINTDFLVSGGGNKYFVFDAARSGVTNVIAGNISDGTNGATVYFTKKGSGDLVLSGNNTYSGITTIQGAGKLFLEGEMSLPDNGTLNLTNFTGKVVVDKREKVDVLQFDGVPQSAGVWGSSATEVYHDFTDDTHFSGTGVLFVGVDFPPEGTVLIIK